MLIKNVHDITKEFEEELSKYTGAPYVIALDNMSNAIFLALYYEKNIKKTLISDKIDCPSKTYPSVPCEIIHAGLKVNFTPVEGETIKGAYQLSPSNVWDSALRFTANMYIPKFSGRRECSYHDDNFDMLGWNFYMMPELSARGLLMMSQFYDLKGNKRHMDDLELPYPDLSKFEVYTKANR